MPLRNILYLSASGLAPFFVGVGTVAFLEEKFFTAWLCAVTTVLLMESRAQLGVRVYRDLFFWLHITFAILFLFSLSLMTFFGKENLYVTTVISFIVLIVPAALLWYRGIAKELQC